jgi:hypothetical protein
MVWKIILFWLCFLIPSGVLAYIHYIIEGSGWKFYYWCENTFLGVIHLMLLRFGVIGMGFYLLILFIKWTFTLIFIN